MQKLTEKYGFGGWASGGVPYYTPCAIWYLLLKESVEELEERDTVKKPVLIYYPNGDPKDICNKEGDILAIVAKVDGKWGYIGIARETLKKVFEDFEQQTY